MPESPSSQLDRIELKLAELEGTVNAAHESSEKIRRYLMWGFWLTVAMMALPLIILPLIVGPFLASLGAGSGL